MSHAYIIEVRSQTAGIVVRNGRNFYFFAATHRFNALEGQAFSSLKDAEKAALRHVAKTNTSYARQPEPVGAGAHGQLQHS